MHPRMAKLVAYHDSEVPPRRAHRVAAHLECCASCRREYERISAEAAEFSASAAADAHGFDRAAGLARLMSAAAGIEMPSTPAADQMRRRVRQALQLYFGAGTAALAEAAAPDEQALLRRAESLFAAFLGWGCAARLIEEIVNGPKRGGLGTQAC